MNPWDLTASELLVWGIVLHLIADWPLQNDWMAKNKMKRRLHQPSELTPSNIPGVAPWPGPVHGPWWDRHPAAYVHAGIHGIFLALIFGWVAIPLGLIHLIVDTRVPIVWWSTKVIKQTQPSETIRTSLWVVPRGNLMDLGTEVRFWTDQVFHIATLAVAALLVTL